MNLNRTTLILLAFFVISGLRLSAQSKTSFDGVTGDIWGDTHGNHIQAHGGQVQKIGNKWWWIGENRSDDRSIMLYSSPDLYNWTPEGDNGKVMRVLPNRNTLDTDPYFTALYGHLSPTEKDLIYDGIYQRKVIERPKLIHNQTTGKYIIWFHADDSNYGAAAAGVAISDNISGPYTYIKRTRLHQLPDDYYGSNWYESTDRRGMSRDMTLFKDDDGTAYIIYSSEENMTMFISRLNDDYTDLDVPQTPIGLAQEGIDFVRLFPGAQREAPAMFKYNNKYYMITSGASGWDPNQARYWMADDILGEWTNMGDPCISESGIPYSASITFSTQSTCVIPVDAEKGMFIYMGDRWKSSNLTDSRYVWLPVYITPTGTIELRSMTDWDLSIFDGMNNVRIDPTKFDSLYFIDNQLPATASVEIRDNNGWSVQNVTLDWDTKISSLPPASLAKIKGNFEFDGIEDAITVKAVNIPKGLLYFIDSGAKEGSDLHRAIVENKLALAPNLINTEIPDQAFSSTDGWGYTGTIEEDIDYRNETSLDAFESGWWAYSDKSIDYKMRLSGNGKYRLTVGFQEWWNTGRNMRASLIYNTTEKEEVIVLGDFNNLTESTEDYVFELTDLDEQNPYITVSISKTRGSDPVMSWLSLTSLDLSSLEIAINTAGGINNDDEQYAPERFAALLQALQEAITVRDDPNATEEDEIQAENKLTMAMLNLELPEEEDPLSEITLEVPVNTTLDVYPNPVKVNQPVYVSMQNESLQQNTVISIYSITAQLIKQQNFTGNLEKIDLSVPSGIYIVSVGQKKAVLIVK